MLIILNAAAMLKEKGLTTYWLAHRIGMSWQNMDHVLKMKTKSIRYETMEAMCRELECTPGELFTLDDERAEN